METNELEYEEENGNKFPIIYVTRDKRTGFCKFKCPHCKVMHKHGRGDGHRVAHCNKPGSPFEHTGYILKTKQGILSSIQDEEYVLTLFNFKDNSSRILSICKHNLNINIKLAEKIIEYYNEHDYTNLTLYSAYLLGLADENNSYIEDCQGIGNGHPDFIIHNKLNYDKEILIELKMNDDALKINQLIECSRLAKTLCECYVLNIKKREYNYNG